MSDTRIRPKVRDAIIRALSAGVVPGQGLQHIQVGRAAEIKTIIKSLDAIADGGSGFKLVVGDYGAGKTFFLQLVRRLAFEKRMVTVHADFSPERRLVASSGQARSFYSEMITNMSTRSRPDGNALNGVIEAFVAKAMSDAESEGSTAAELIQVRLAPVKWIQLARLSETSRDRVWEYLRSNRPDVAETLEQTTRNPQVQELLADCNASLAIQQDWLPQSMVASLSFH